MYRTREGSRTAPPRASDTIALLGLAALEARFRRNCRVGFGAIAPDVVDRTSNRFGFIPAVPGLLTGGSADDAEQKLTPEIDCFRFCPYTRDSTETTQHLGGLGNRIFNIG